MQPLTKNTIVFDRYRLERKLGAGGKGAVWLAHDQSLDSPCALKLVETAGVGDDEVRMRCRREAKAAARIRCPNVVDVFQHGVWEGTPFIAMEFLEGEDLGVRLARVGRLDPLSTYRIAAQVARALSRAHAAGIVHRDIKPENIFLVPGDEHELAKVLDFGLARHDTYALLDNATQIGSFLGTPQYVSPEQARGNGVDWRSDLWSLGVVVFFCLTGRRPFESEVIGELMGLILYEPIPKLSEYDPDLTKLLDAWWKRAVARNPDERFQSAKEFADSLAAAIGEPALAVPSLAPHVSYQQPSEQEPLPIALHHRRRIAKKRRALVLGTGGSALLGFLLLVMPGLSGGAPEQAIPPHETPFVEPARETEPTAAQPQPKTSTAEPIQSAPTPSSQARSKTADPSATADSKSKRRQDKKVQSASQPKPSEQFIVSERDYGI